MTEVSIRCPLPLVTKVVRRAKELGGIEMQWPYGDPRERWPVERHGVHFQFLDTARGKRFFEETNTWVWQWERENEPDEEL